MSLKITKSKKDRKFDPAVFLQTSAKGRIVSSHKKREIIFKQGDAADSVVYINPAK